MTTPSFNKGAEAMEEAAARANSGSFKKVHFFGLKDGETAILRFLTESTDFITVLQHGMVSTKPAPADLEDKTKWPRVMGAVCRHDKQFTGMYEDCFICDFMTKADGKPYKPSARGWALAVLREEVIESGKKVGIKDLTREVVVPGRDGQPDTKTIEPAVVIVNMGYKNFFSTVIGYAQKFGTLLERDLWIKRKGSDTDTDYTIIPEDPINRDDGNIYTTADPEIQKKYEIVGISLEDEVTSRSSDEFYGRFFDTRVTNASSKPAEGAPADQQQKPSTEPDADRLAELANRVRQGPETAPQEPVASGMRSYE